MSFQSGKIAGKEESEPGVVVLGVQSERRVMIGWNRTEKEWIGVQKGLMWQERNERRTKE